MARYQGSFAKPENALKRSEELIAVGQQSAALQALYDVVTSKKHRTWQKSLEQVMFKFVELCVETRKAKHVKDGLLQYRIVCQLVNVSSLEEVIKHLLRLATDKADAAHQAASGVDSIADLEAQHTPEAILEAFAGAEKSKDRADRESVAPHFKFLWETHRTILEVLKNNNKVEALYSMAGARAFHFCKQYRRSVECRRLADMLRNHLSQLFRYKELRDRPDLGNTETFQHYVDMRFEQLKVSCELSLWQEAFRSIEDIHGLMATVKKSPRPPMMQVYYSKLSDIFWVSENELHHAYSLDRLFAFTRAHNQGISNDDAQKLASSVLLSTLSVTPQPQEVGDNAVDHTDEHEGNKERNVRLAMLLGFAIDPNKDTYNTLSRRALLRDLSAKGVHAMALPEVRSLSALLEDEYSPLDMCQRASELIEKIKQKDDTLSSAAPRQTADFRRYSEPLMRVAVFRFLEQAPTIFSRLHVDSLHRLAGHGDVGKNVEKVAREAQKNGMVDLKIDHANEAVLFGRGRLGKDKLDNGLAELAARMEEAEEMIDPAGEEETNLPEDVAGQVEEEHKWALARRSLIERRKEEEERQIQKQEEEEEERKRQQAKASEDAEAKRLEEERRQREQERIRKNIEEKEREEAMALLEQQQKKKGKKGKVNMQGGQQLDKKRLMEDALQEQKKEKMDKDKKLSKQARQLDHFERAKREEEAQLIEEHYRRVREEDKEFQKRLQEEDEQQRRRQWEQDLQEKRRLSRVDEERRQLEEVVVQRRQKEVEAARAQRLREKEEARARNKELRKQKRKDKYLHMLKQEEERRARERAEEEERKRKEQEEKEKEERLKKQRDDAERARVERLERESRAQQVPPTDTSANGAERTQPPQSEKGAWRPRAPERPPPQQRHPEAAGAEASTNSWRSKEEKKGEEGSSQRPRENSTWRRGQSDRDGGGRRGGVGGGGFGSSRDESDRASKSGSWR